MANNQSSRLAPRDVPLAERAVYSRKIVAPGATGSPVSSRSYLVSSNVSSSSGVVLSCRRIPQPLLFSCMITPVVGGSPTRPTRSDRRSPLPGVHGRVTKCTLLSGSRLAPLTGVARLPPDRQQKSREFGQPYDRFIAKTGLWEWGTSVRPITHFRSKSTTVPRSPARHVFAQTSRLFCCRSSLS